MSERWYVRFARSLGFEGKDALRIRKMLSQFMMEELAKGGEVELDGIGKIKSEYVKEHDRFVGIWGKVYRVRPYVRLYLKQSVTGKSRLLEMSPVGKLNEFGTDLLVGGEDYDTEGRHAVEREE